MNTDDLRALAQHAEGVHGREAERLVEVRDRIRVARRRRRTGAIVGSAAAVVTSVALAVGLSSVGGPAGRTDDPVDAPTSTPSPSRTERPEKTLVPPKGTKRLSPRQTVLSYNARLVAAAYAPDDPDVRVSVWETECLVCPKGNPRRFSYQTIFQAIAVTEDGYRTAAYLRPGMAILNSIHSVARDAFLFNDTSNGVQRLLETDGTYRRVRMVDETRTPDDPRLTIPCGGFAGGYGAGWCVLDVPTATAARLPSTWTGNGSPASNPALGQRPWGLDASPVVSSDPAVSAWWDDDGVRRSTPTPVTGLDAFQTVPSLSKGDDTPTYVRWTRWSHRLDVFAVEDRSGGLRKIGSRSFVPVSRDEIAAVGQPKMVSLVPDYARTPDGALLAWSYREDTIRPGLTIWRAPSLTSGEFETVYQGPRLDSSGIVFTPGLTSHEGVLHIGTLTSEDDGRTWSEPVTTWR